LTFFIAVASTRSTPEIYNTIREFLEQSTQFHFAPAEISRYYGIDFDHFKFLTYELFLYFLAVCFRAKRYAEINDFLSREFYAFENCDRREFMNFINFRPYLESLEKQRNQRLHKGSRVSVTADLLEERALHPTIKFADIANIDLLLYVRTVLSQQSLTWYPWTLSHRARVRFNPFHWAQSTTNFRSLKIVLGVSPDLSGMQLAEIFQRNGGGQHLNTNGFSRFHISQVIDFQLLGTRP
jgi:hypothetical protein